ncbi:hypothetical protein [Candidatus Frankia nodulisporulans]|uniref:hypothetical protein n=1 Tax=Candidatus Frankia nodulisporulans TaxID=2060052 RepID=UPI0013D2AA9F|nr:hypothetical protein [Candidatus Frankia nodulisporulans]
MKSVFEFLKGAHDYVHSSRHPRAQPLLLLVSPVLLSGQGSVLLSPGPWTLPRYDMTAVKDVPGELRWILHVRAGLTVRIGHRIDSFDRPGGESHQYYSCQLAYPELSQPTAEYQWFTEIQATEKIDDEFDLGMIRWAFSAHDH